MSNQRVKFCICAIVAAVSITTSYSVAAPHIKPIPVPRPAITASPGSAEIQPVISQPADVPLAPVTSNYVPTPKDRPQSITAPVQTAVPTVTNDDQDLLQQLSVAYSNVQSLKADFVQLSGNQRTSGVLTLVKPGKFHFAYNAPSTIDVMCDGKTVLVRDKKLRTNDVYALDQTPLRVLLTQKIDLTKDVKITAIHRKPDIIEVVIDESKSALQGQITLYFNRATFALQQWSIVDAQGIETDIALSNISTNLKINTQQFAIDFESIRQESAVKGN